MWARWFNLLLGIWLFLAPFVLRYSEPAARVNDVAVGIGVIAASLASFSLSTLRYINTVLGAWLLIAPWLLVYGEDILPTANDVLVGLGVLGLSLVPAHPDRLRRLRLPVRT